MDAERGAQMDYFSSRGLRLAYQSEGQGRPIILVHGFAATHEVNWIVPGWSRALIDAGYRVIMPDGVGHGDSDKPYALAAYKLEDVARDIVTLLDHVGEGRVDIMGYSMGASIALVAAMNCPDRFGRVIAAGIGENLLRPPPDTEVVAEALLTDDVANIKSGRAAAFRSFADTNNQDRKALALCFAQARKTFPSEKLQNIQSSVLVIAGEKDNVAGHPKPLADLIPNAQASVVPNCDHMSMVAASEYRKAVFSFLNGT